MVATGSSTPERAHVEVRGRPVEVWTAAGEGAPIVLVHGASGHRDTWLPLWAALAPAPRVALSLAGRPGSEGPPAKTAGAAAEWLVEVLKALELAPPLLVGHSFGGAVALEVALSAYALSGLALVATGAKLRVSPLLLAAAEAATEPLPMEAAFGPGTAAEVVKAYHQASAQTPPSTALADWRACDGFDVRERLSELRGPTLVLHGDDDGMTPAKFQTYLEASIEGAVREEVKKTGHMLPWEQPERFVRSLLAFRR